MEAEDDKYERKGDYYQCIKCEQYSVHINDDKHCENAHCPSNQGKIQHRGAPSKKSTMSGSTGMKSSAYGSEKIRIGTKKICPTCNQHMDSNGKCLRCAKLQQARKSGGAGSTSGGAQIKNMTVVNQGRSKAAKQCPSCKRL